MITRLIYFTENAAHGNSQLQNLSEQYSNRTNRLTSELAKTRQDHALQVTRYCTLFHRKHCNGCNKDIKPHTLL